MKRARQERNHLWVTGDSVANLTVERAALSPRRYERVREPLGVCPIKERKSLSRCWNEDSQAMAGDGVIGGNRHPNRESSSALAVGACRYVVLGFANRSGEESLRLTSLSEIHCKKIEAVHTEQKQLVLTERHSVPSERLEEEGPWNGRGHVS